MNSETTLNNKESDTNKNSDKSSKKVNSNLRPKAAWKYIHPADKDQINTDQSENVWKFCEKCICQAT